MLNIGTSIDKLPRMDRKYAANLKHLGIETVRDLLLHLPFRYDDYSETVSISNLQIGTQATVEGTVVSSKALRTWKKRMRLTEAVIEDNSGSMRAVWFNQPYVSTALVEGKRIRLSGKVSCDRNGLFFSNPAWERSSRLPTNTGRLVPVYPETEGISSRWLRWQLANIFKTGFETADPIPGDILTELKLPDLKTALKYIHFPKNPDESEIARKRFAFEEMLLVQLASLQVKLAWENENAAAIAFDEDLVKSFVSGLPFTLTDAQRKAAFQIFKDLEKPRPMNRLLNGDVGSGKTLVAAMAALEIAEAGYQTVIMAPTEVLARQHFESISKLFAAYDVSLALLTNSYQLVNSNSKSAPNAKTANSRRANLLNAIRVGDIKLIIGTHALIQKDVSFKNLALVIIDEQHRFGVAQRAYLQQRAAEINDGLPGKIPHFLAMTATPIPRTLSLAFFGNLDLSILDQMPKNRKPIITEVVRENRRKRVYDFVRSQVSQGRQAFFILPLVEESTALSDVKAAVEEHARLKAEVFPELKIGLLHGRLKSREKEEVMQDFKDKKYDVLVATAVVEVGIDVPNATVIVIEDAERFGLAQLHQFRGRVGRGQHQSFCYLFAASGKKNSRLEALAASNDGFAIAEQDLRLRGPGEFLGTRQSGLPDIAMEHLANTKLIALSREKAVRILTSDPTLKNHPLLKKELAKFSQSVHLE